AVFQGEHPGGEGLGGVAVDDGHPPLDDGRAAVQFLGDEVHGGAGLVVAGVDGPLVGVEARVFGQQGRVDVHQPAPVVAHETGGEDAHEAGEDHQIRGVGVDAPGQGLVEALTVGE